ncbi:hypothetical protein ID866_12404 [Astraeus odoratus]|nr:hypothetical protein ID866_12404 [Astraeus odoratus]
MSMHKSSMTTGAPATKTVNWTEVPDEELATNIDDMDLVGNAKAWEKHRRLCMACDEEIQKTEKVQREAEEQEQKCQAEEAEKCWKEEELHYSSGCQEEVGVAATSPQGREWKKQVKKAANDDDNNKIVILSSRKTKQQGGGETLEEVTDRQWGELIQAVSSCIDIANGHLEQIVSAAQSNGHKMQWHHLLMEGLVGQQQMLVSRLVKIASTAGSGGAREVVEGSEEPKEPQEMQGEGLGGQEGTEGVPGGALEGELEDVPGNEPENGTGEEGQKRDKGKGKEKAL